MTWFIDINFCPPFPIRLHIKLASIREAVSQEKMFEIVEDKLMMVISVIMWELSVSKFKLYGNYPKVVDYLLKWQ